MTGSHRCTRRCKTEDNRRNHATERTAITLRRWAATPEWRTEPLFKVNISATSQASLHHASLRLIWVLDAAFHRSKKQYPQAQDSVEAKKRFDKGLTRLITCITSTEALVELQSLPKHMA